MTRELHFTEPALPVRNIDQLRNRRLGLRDLADPLATDYKELINGGMP